MDRETLNKNLSELEQQLKDVKSANERVDSVIAEDKQLVKSINDYVVKADAVLKELSTAYDKAIKKSGEAVNTEVVKTSSTLLEEHKKALADDLAEMKKHLESNKKVLDKKAAELTEIVDNKLLPLKDSLSRIVENDLPNMLGRCERTIEEARGMLYSAASTLQEVCASFEAQSREVLDHFGESTQKIEHIEKSVKWIRIMIWGVLAVQVLSVVLFLALKYFKLI